MDLRVDVVTVRPICVVVLVEVPVAAVVARHAVLKDVRVEGRGQLVHEDEGAADGGRRLLVAVAFRPQLRALGVRHERAVGAEEALLAPELERKGKWYGKYHGK